MAPLVGGRVRAVVGATLVIAIASLGWVAAGVGGSVGADTSVTRHVQSHCTKKTSILHALECATKTLPPDRSLSASSDTVKVTPTGRGMVSVATYVKDPVGALTSSTGTYFGVWLSSPNGFTALTVKDCNLAGGTALYWWNGDTWLPVALQPGSVSSATITCVTDTLGAESSPNLATITHFSRLTSTGAVVFSVR